MGCRTTEGNMVVPEKRGRPTTVASVTYKVSVGCGNLYVTLGKDEDGTVIELFARLGKGGTCAICQNEATTRAVSLGLRYGVPPWEYVLQLEGIRCPSASIDEGEKITSCADAIAKVLRKECCDKVNVKQE